ncbi:hypothetical protein [Mycoplasma simbae]|uniref:hypothetical protein n=1 Tax=Mycoplasma simbae TaxID=36744 RepID=UPI00049706FC|nr:hypothetical protein [Mycoplasma simbae]
MNNKEKIIEKFNNTKRELNGYSVPGIHEVINEFVYLCEQQQIQIKNLEEIIAKQVGEIDALKAQVSRLEFQNKLESDEK